jgi:branched-chain amino acid transport system substrate-binding protein
MMLARRRTRTVGLAIAALALLAAGCSNASNGGGGGGGSGAPGVTSNSITVGSLAALSGPLSAGFGDITYGVKAYFDMVNAQGGVDGRKIILGKVADDQGNATTDEIQARNLVVQDHVFAVVGVGTPFFEAGPYLASKGTPTFGYLVEGGWDKYPNLFGAYGSVLYYGGNGGALTFVARQIHAQSVAVLSYGFVATSKDACQAGASQLQQNGVSISYQDLNMGYLADPTPDVQQIAAKHGDMVFTCVDGPENLKIAQTLRQYGVNARMIWLNGYDRSVAAQNASVMAGDLFQIQHIPFESAKEYPGKYPSMQQYIDTMNKYEPQWTYDDVSFQGWINAELFVAGLKAAGRDLTQAKLVNAINNMTDFTAGGLMSPINWKTAHTQATPPFCSAWVEVTFLGTYVSAFVQNGDQTYMCFNSGISPDPIKLPSGVEPTS